ncbi:MAG: LysR family transcriptional regulator [Clostridium sp.]
MNLSYLRSFYITVKCNSISKAAKELHLSQPGLSMQLQSFENEIGSKLLNRSNKGVELTEEGKLVFEFGESMLSLQDNLDRKLKNLKENKSKLSISACKSLGEQILPCSIYTFKEIHFNIDVSMEVDNSTNILKRLQNHDTNIGIIHGINDIPDNVVTETMMSDKLVLVSGKNSLIDSITINELISLPLILREDGSGTLSVLDKALKKQNLSVNNLNVLLSLNSPESIKSSVVSGRGYTFMPELSIAHELRTGALKKINIEGLTIPFDYYLALRKNYCLADSEEKFLAFLTSKKRCFCY